MKSSVSLAADAGRLKLIHMIELSTTSIADPRNGGSKRRRDASSLPPTRWGADGPWLEVSCKGPFLAFLSFCPLSLNFQSLSHFKEQRDETGEGTKSPHLQ